MTIAADQIRLRFERLLSLGEALLRGAVSHGLPGGASRVEAQAYGSWRAQAEAALMDVFGERHAYTRNFAANGNDTSLSSVRKQVGVIGGALDAITHGEVACLASLVVANVFEHLIEMAEHLHAASYHIPAASLCGAVLEDALRRLCDARSISYAKKEGIDALNKKLAAAQVYDNFTVSSIDAWRHLRNDADHGHFLKVPTQNVASMLEGVRRFLAQHARDLAGGP